MATTTPNFGWSVPTSTDLVKDGATAIETLGDAIDASLLDLKGGTTGQSLTKNSNTDMDFVWATPAAGGMTSIATGSLSGTAVAITSIPTTYKHLQLVIRNYQPSLDTLMTIRLNNDSAARYAFSSSSYSTGAFGSNEGRFTEDSDNGTSYSLVVADFYDYANTSTWKRLNSMAMTNNASTPTSYTFVEYKTFYNQTAAITQINLQANIYSGSATFSGGTYILYGVS
jgi:hypothetical protein